MSTGISDRASAMRREASGSQNPSGEEMMRFILSPGYAFLVISFVALFVIGVIHKDSSSPWLVVDVIAVFLLAFPVLPFLPVSLIAYAGIVVVGLAGLVVDVVRCAGILLGKCVGLFIGASHRVKTAPKNRRASIDRHHGPCDEHCSLAPSSFQGHGIMLQKAGQDKTGDPGEERQEILVERQTERKTDSAPKSLASKQLEERNGPCPHFPPGHDASVTDTADRQPCLELTIRISIPAEQPDLSRTF